MRIYSISDEYIEYLRADKKLKDVFDNKGETGHTRKYLGIVIERNSFSYYIPFSSPKDTDYQIVNGIRQIRRSIIPIIRMTSVDKDGNIELKGTLKINNMIPVPKQELKEYDINQERDTAYKIVVQKEYKFIKKNEKLIRKNAAVLYNQKTKEHEIYKTIEKKPGYLKQTIDFLYAEEKCRIYCQLHNFSIQGSSKPSLSKLLNEIQK